MTTQLTMWLLTIVVAVIGIVAGVMMVMPKRSSAIRLIGLAIALVALAAFVYQFRSFPIEINSVDFSLGQ